MEVAAMARAVLLALVHLDVESLREFRPFTRIVRSRGEAGPEVLSRAILMRYLVEEPRQEFRRKLAIWEQIFVGVESVAMSKGMPSGFGYALLHIFGSPAHRSRRLLLVRAEFHQLEAAGALLNGGHTVVAVNGRTLALRPGRWPSVRLVPSLLEQPLLPRAPKEAALGARWRSLVQVRPAWKLGGPDVGWLVLLVSGRLLEREAQRRGTRTEARWPFPWRSSWRLLGGRPRTSPGVALPRWRGRGRRRQCRGARS